MSDIRISFDTMKSEFKRILFALQFSEYKAKTCAQVFAESSLDGVYSHGVLRFPRFVEYIKKGYINIDAEPEKKASLGALEQWDGELGPGILNALAATDRAMAVADQFGIGCVALANTNHWMRGGSYSWRAAKAGYGFIGWTNTEPNMPAWGAAESRLGNNPLVMALPVGEQTIVLDMAMTQFSYGKLEDFKIRGEKLPVPGGFDKNGNITSDPAEILETMQGLPIGYWKGAGLSMLLDLMAATLSGGDSTRDIGERQDEYGVSQIFIAFTPNIMQNARIQARLEKAIEHYKKATPMGENIISYPGERTMKTRAENLKKGIPVPQTVWQQILKL